MFIFSETSSGSGWLIQIAARLTDDQLVARGLQIAEHCFSHRVDNSAKHFLRRDAARTDEHVALCLPFQIIRCNSSSCICWGPNLQNKQLWRPD
jgi:hypothetical protein